MTGLSLPPRLTEEVMRFRDGVGAAWLDGLPRLVAECVERWDLSLAAPYAYPSLSFVAPATRRDGSAAVLKVGFLVDELACEIAALRLFDGWGAIRLLDAIAQHGVLLLERLEPGDDLHSVPDDDEATAIAARVMRKLWRPAPAEHPFPTVARWGRGLTRLRERFGGGTGPLPAHLVERAEGILADAAASRTEPVLLHGDLQHYNVLRAQREPWLAIDPKGVVGDPAYEVGPLLYNRLEGAAEPCRVLSRRLALLADELGMDRQRLARWGLVGAVLSAWWSVEDAGEPGGIAVTCAECLADLAP